MTNARSAKSARDKAAALRAEAARTEARHRTLIVGGSVAAVLAIIVGIVVLFQVAKNNQDQKIAAAQAPPANLATGAPEIAGGMVLGQATAKVTMQINEDFQCPACKSFEEANKEQFTKWVTDGTVRFVYRPVAILDRFSTTEYSTRSLNAVAAVVNSDPATFKAFHDALFANQPPENGDGLPDATLIDLAVKAGAKKDAIETAITSRKYAGWVKKVTDDASKGGLKGTPTIKVNGKEIKSYDPKAIAEAVNAALKG